MTKLNTNTAVESVLQSNRWKQLSLCVYSSVYRQRDTAREGQARNGVKCFALHYGWPEETHRDQRPGTQQCSGQSSQVGRGGKHQPCHAYRAHCDIPTSSWFGRNELCTSVACPSQSYLPSATCASCLQFLRWWVQGQHMMFLNRQV